MKAKWKILIPCIAIPLVLGGIAGLISSGSMEGFGQLNKPPLSPPGWLFPIVWTILYIAMGVASYLYITKMQVQTKIPTALILYGMQLIFNILWPIWFFNLQLYSFAFAWLIVLWLLIFMTMLTFYPVSRPAAWLLVPYLLWVIFAGYLNLGIALLN